MKTLGITYLRHNMRDVVSRILAGEAFTLTNYQRDLATISPHIPVGQYTAVPGIIGPIAVYCVPCGQTMPTASPDITDLNATVHAHNAQHHGSDQ